MVENIQIHLFYPMLFVTLIILTIAICSVIKSRNGNMTFKDMFCKSSDNAKEVTIDTTSKMKDMHSDVVKLEFTTAHEKELHHLELMVEELNDKVDLLFAYCTKCKNRKK